MRGRKLYFIMYCYSNRCLVNKKRIPEWGDGNIFKYNSFNDFKPIKKESPNEGTETRPKREYMISIGAWNKKRIPEWGDGNQTVLHNNDHPHLL